MDTVFSILALVSGMSGMQQYDYVDHERVSATVSIAQERLKTQCVPFYSEASQELGAVVVPMYCGLEKVKNLTTGEVYHQETTFDLAVYPSEYAYLKTNILTKTNK